MGRPAQDITESELSVLRILWERGTATIRQLTDILYPGGEAAQYATVQKLLDRMETKGYVRRDRAMYVHVFAPLLDRDQLIGRRLRSLAEMLCDGSLTPLLTHLRAPPTFPRRTVSRCGPSWRSLIPTNQRSTAARLRPWPRLKKHRVHPAVAQPAEGMEVPAVNNDTERREEVALSWNRSCMPC